MKIIFNDDELAALTNEERNRVITLIRKQGLNKIELSNDKEQNVLTGSDGRTCALAEHVLFNNLMELQGDALRLEEQLSKLQERNKYLEEKVNWLRGKAGDINFIPSKAKPEFRGGADNSSLQSALVDVINKMESKLRGRVGLSFAKSKRARRDKSLISKSEYFDKEYIVSQLKQLGLQVKDPLEFFISFGAELELSPSEKFDTKSYLAMNPDVKDSGINPLLHYIKHGKAEGRVLI